MPLQTLRYNPVQSTNWSQLPRTSAEDLVMVMGKDKKSDKSGGKKNGDAAGGSGKVKAAQQINVRHILVNSLFF
jgi:hypothetical protein